MRHAKFNTYQEALQRSALVVGLGSRHKARLQLYHYHKLSVSDLI